MRIYCEITNICNKKCDFCVDTKREKVFLLPEVFASRLNKIRPFADEIYLHILGESMLHPDFLEIIGSVANNNITLKITTNGTKLTPQNQAGLLANKNFRQINFSLHALSLEEINGDILQNILDFSQALRNSRQDTFVNYRLWNFNTQDTLKNELILTKIGDFFGFPDLKLHPHRRTTKICDQLYINVDQRFDWPTTLGDMSNRQVHRFCYGGSGHLGILVDGTVVPCCLDSEGDIPLGNIDQVNDFSEILSSKRLIALVDNFAKEYAIEPFCQKCTFKNRFVVKGK